MTENHPRKDEIDYAAAMLVEANVRTAGIAVWNNGRPTYSVLDNPCLSYQPLSEPLESALLRLLLCVSDEDEWAGSADIDTPRYSFGYADISSHADNIVAWQVYFTTKEPK